MCYSAQIMADFHAYERMGRKLDIDAFVKLFWERRKRGDLVKVVPKAMRAAFLNPENEEQGRVRGALLQAYRSVSLVLEQELFSD